MSIQFDSKVAEEVTAAKLTAGATDNRKLSFQEVAGLLASRGIDFKITENKEIEIIDVAIIPAFGKMEISFYDRIVQGKLEVVPRTPIFFSHDKPSTDYFEREENMVKKIPHSVPLFIRSLFPVQQIPLSEDLVQLPVPDWAYFDDEDRGAFGCAPDSDIMFRSQAEKAWAEFIANTNPVEIFSEVPFVVDEDEEDEDEA